MARPPSNRSLTLEDIPGAPAWVERLLERLNAFTAPTAAALSQGLTLSENFAGEVKTITVTPPEDWRALTLANSWAVTTAYVTPGYRQDADGCVIFRGVLERSGAPTAGTNVVTGLPTADGVQPAVIVTDTGLGAADVSGTSLVYYGGGVARFGLSGVRYTAANRNPPRWASPVDVRLGTQQKPFPGRPGYVLALRARVANAPSSPALVTAVDWEPTVLEGDKKSLGVRIHRLWGLAPSTAHNVTLLVLPE